MTRQRFPTSILLAALTITGLTVASANGQPPASDCAGKPIASIRFEGKFKLRRYILKREIDSDVGAPLDPAQLDRDRQRIESFGIFSRVKPLVEDRGDSVDLVFSLREVWTIEPLLSLRTTDGKIDWSVGVADKNFLGYFVQPRILYRRYEDKNSGFLYLIAPRAFGKDLSLGLSLTDQREIQPLGRLGESADYDYLNKSIAVSVGHRLHENVYPRVSGGYDRENWTMRDGQTTINDFIASIDHPRYFIGLGVVLGRVYYDHYLYTGQDVSHDFTMIDELPEGRFNKWRYSLTARKLWIMHPFNFGLRGSYQTSSSDERVPPFAISGESNVRGFADKIERGDQLLFGNAEIRLQVLDRHTFYSQLAVFADYGAVWGRWRTASTAFRDPYWSIGVGLRGAIQQWLGRIGRIDLALNPQTGHISLYMAKSQFF